jgi:hypothetical protein
VSAVRESLRQVMAIEGVRAAALAGIAAGMVAQSAGHMALFVDLDRVNPALASLRLSRLAPAVLA